MTNTIHTWVQMHVDIDVNIGILNANDNILYKKDKMHDDNTSHKDYTWWQWRWAQDACKISIWNAPTVAKICSHICSTMMQERVYYMVQNEITIKCMIMTKILHVWVQMHVDIVNAWLPLTEMQMHDRGKKWDATIICK